MRFDLKGSVAEIITMNHSLCSIIVILLLVRKGKTIKDIILRRKKNV